MNPQLRGDGRLRMSSSQQCLDCHTILVAEVVVHISRVARLLIFPSVPRQLLHFRRGFTK